MTQVIYLDAGALIDLQETGYGHLATNNVQYRVPDITLFDDNLRDFVVSAFQDWANSGTASVEIEDVSSRLDLSDPAVRNQYSVTLRADGTYKQAGDAALKFLEDADGIFSQQGASVVTNDRGLMDFANQNSSGRGAYTTTMDLFNELLENGELSSQDYRSVTASLGRPNQFCIPC